jgi:hypothetical protein
LFSEQIRGKRGEIWAHIFENKSTGLVRNLYWAFDIECAPINWQDRSWDCSVQCEWLAWPLRQWKDLDGKTLGESTYPNLVQCSFYFADHHPVALSELSIRRIASTQFQATLQGKFDLPGFDHLDELNIHLALACEISFSGVIVVPGNLEPKPTNTAQARAVVEPFISTDDFHEPRWDRFRYVLAPRG